MPDLTHITADEAVAALTAAAHEVTDEWSINHGRTLIHCMAGAFGADWDLDLAIATVRGARDIAWMDDLTGHDLGVLTEDGRVRKFNVKRPTGEAVAS